MKKTMKHNRWVLVLLGLLMLPLTAMADNDKVIETEQLPAAARTTLSKYFRGKDVALVTMDTEVFGKSYEVVFADGDKIEFNKKGEWKEISCATSPIDSKYIPRQIIDAVATRWPGEKFKKIERYKYGYEVELTNHLELKFDKIYRLTEVDD